LVQALVNNPQPAAIATNANWLHSTRRGWWRTSPLKSPLSSLFRMKYHPLKEIAQPTQTPPTLEADQGDKY
ncbi:hypothetical protein A2U01_0110434, partial [Trifolium medium]|nr:hypothetical protein [Trifolium medium]